MTHSEGMNGSVAREIRREAARQGMNDAKLAESVGMHPTVLSRYLNCKRAMTLEVVERLVNGLGLDWLLQWERRSVRVEDDHICEIPDRPGKYVCECGTTWYPGSD